MTSNTPLAQRLHNSAQGTYPTEAAAIVHTQTVAGTLPTKLAPAITDHPTYDRAAIDWDHAIALAAPFSGGERRLIHLAASLAEQHPVPLRDVLSGLDQTNASIVLAALAHCLRINR